MTEDQDRTYRPRYCARSSTLTPEPGHWAERRVEVVDSSDDSVVGVYHYNYSMTPPFFAFELEGQWYALYARDYTATRLMRLPECEDVWGEEPDSLGFCPVEFYVPAVQHTTFGGDRTGKMTGTYDTKDFEEPHRDAELDWTIGPIVYQSFGFVSGCIWGDDSSWKLRFIDLSRVAEGIVVCDERFGYRELHPKLTLAESVEIVLSDPVSVELFTSCRYGLDGKPSKEVT